MQTISIKLFFYERCFSSKLNFLHSFSAPYYFRWDNFWRSSVGNKFCRSYKGCWRNIKVLSLPPTLLCVHLYIIFSTMSWWIAPTLMQVRSSLKFYLISPQNSFWLASPVIQSLERCWNNNGCTLQNAIVAVKLEVFPKCCINYASSYSIWSLMH